MAGGSRTLKLTILGDVDQLKKSLNQGERDAQGFGNKMDEVGAKIGAAFKVAALAAAAYAVKIGIDGVKAAIEDEAAQVRLAGALKSATGATDEQIAATETYITKMQLATGVTDTELRAAFQRLSISTRDVGKSQDLMNLAMDISKGTGKDLASVTEALAKAYEGNDTKLAKLGIGITSADAKTLSFRDETDKLAQLWGGAASKYAETFEGRIARLKQGFEETKESIGAALLPVLEKLLGYIFQYGLPLFEKFKEAWKTILQAVKDNESKFTDFIYLLKTYVLPVLQTVLSGLMNMAATTASVIINVFGTIAGAITPVINFIIDSINLVIRGLNLIKPGADIGYLGKVGAPSSANGGRPVGESYSTGNPTVNTPTVTVPSLSGSGSSGGGSTGSGLSGIEVAASAMPAADAIKLSNAQGARLRADMANSDSITINIGIAGDPEATARTIVDTLNSSYYRGTGGAGALTGLVSA